MPTPESTHSAIVKASVDACTKINAFAREVLHTRGGRIGSGMGTLLEALWGYFTNHGLSLAFKGEDQCELAWMYGHEYNDFACVLKSAEWDPATRKGELLRVETKSMVASADESKAHFDQIVKALADHDLMVVIVWDWTSIDEQRVCPQIRDHFVGPARPIAILRDELHKARGGSFVDASSCPDQCDPSVCPHDGEPLNERGKRERLSGPEATRVSRTVSYAANFGGMVRMLKTNSEAARRIFRDARLNDDVVHAYISFIHRNFPQEEANQYTAAEWKQLGELLGLQTSRLGKQELISQIREGYPGYEEQLRDLSQRRPLRTQEKVLSDELATTTIPEAGPTEEPARRRSLSQLASPQAADESLASEVQHLLERLQSSVESSSAEEEA